MSSSPAEPTARGRLPWLTVAVIGVVSLLACLVALSVGRFHVPVNEVARMLTDRVLPLERTWYEQEESIVFEVRLPRVILSFLVGSALAIAGAVLQSVFRNPLVSPQVLGVSAGASFGGVLSMVLGLGSAGLVGGAFVFGLGALVCVVAFSRIVSTAPLLMIVLGGVVISALFSALTSLMTYVADPYRDLPAITFWLLGSLATAGWGSVTTALPPIILGTVVVLLLRWRLNILALGDDDAQALGVPPAPYRNALLLAVALLTAAAIAVSGVIGWVGLLVPHLSRLLVGSDNRVLLPASFLLGGGYLTVVDTLARTLSPVEVPLGILTAIIGAPFFVILLARFRKRVWLSD
ncbi:FecCD family ABC transporter permease [Actinomyces wuliandei]|uniref:FecCD family ABC transporter permease n=1 Tax=Actinomyces wuliandei TaxID=2057743 RepID=UPI000FD72A2E|nr:iron ABC transporter permease [Actinomyces wuliandei]